MGRAGLEPVTHWFMIRAFRPARPRCCLPPLEFDPDLAGACSSAEDPRAESYADRDDGAGIVHDLATAPDDGTTPMVEKVSVPSSIRMTLR